MTTYAELQRRSGNRRPPPRGPSPSGGGGSGPVRVVVGIVVTVAALVGRVYLRSVLTRHREPPTELVTMFYQYIDDVTRANEELDQMAASGGVSPGGVAAELESEATDIEQLIGNAQRLPKFTEQNLDQVATTCQQRAVAQVERFKAALLRLRGTVAADSPLVPAVRHLSAAIERFPNALLSVARGTPVPDPEPTPGTPAVTPPPPPPVVLPAGAPPQRPPVPFARSEFGRTRPTAVPARPPVFLSIGLPEDQVVTVTVHGLPNRTVELDGIQSRLMQRFAATNGAGIPAEDDPSAVVIAFGPATDVAAVAAAAGELGPATFDAAARTVTVHANADTVRRMFDPAAAPPPAPAAVEPPALLPAVIPVGTALDVERGGSWVPASVLKREGRRYRVHYDGESPATDEWVGKDRMRPAGAN